MKILGIILTVIGILLIGYSVTLKPYSNLEEYEQKYLALDGDNKSEQFFELRKTYLTEKYQFEDYGLTSIVLGIYMLIFFFKGWRLFKIPNHKSKIGLIGIIAVLISVFGYVGDLILESSRGSYPHWADSLGIPLMTEVPLMFIILLIWFALNLIGLKKPFKTGGLVSNLNIKSINYWYATVLVLLLIQSISLIFYADFWSTAAIMLWNYFHLSLLVGRREGVIEEESRVGKGESHP
jgi:hypothetical protein